MNKTIALIAGDYWHAPGPWHSVLAAITQSLGFALATYADANPLSRVLAKPAPALLILVREGKKPENYQDKDFWLSEADEASLAAYVHGGGRLAALHCGVCTYRRGGPVRTMMRGHFVNHPEESDHLVRPVAAAGLDLGFAAFAVHDEFYEVDTDPTRTTVFAEIVSAQHGRQIAGWGHGYGAGRVIAFTPGHNRSILDDPAYRDVVRDIIACLTMD